MSNHGESADGDQLNEHLSKSMPSKVLQRVSQDMLSPSHELSPIFVSNIVHPAYQYLITYKEKENFVEVPHHWKDDCF